MRVAALLVALSLTGASVPALACTPPLDQAERDKAYYRSVTSVYRVVAEEFRPLDPRYPSDDFRVRMRPIESIWGQRPSEPITLTFTPGMCSDWGIESVEQGETLNGREYIVFLASPGQKDLRNLHILPAGDRTAAEALVLLGRLQASGGSAPQPEDDVLPTWPPPGVSNAAAPTFLWSLKLHWPVFVGLGTFLILFGVVVGRVSRPSRMKTPQ